MRARALLLITVFWLVSACSACSGHRRAKPGSPARGHEPHGPHHHWKKPDSHDRKHDGHGKKHEKHHGAGVSHDPKKGDPDDITVEVVDAGPPATAAPSSSQGVDGGREIFAP